jgi:hypothetical protein
MEDRPILPTDIYRMKCVEADLKDDSFAKPNKDGSQPQKFSTVWEVISLTEEQQEIADELDQEWPGVRIWKDFAPYYGDVKAGGPSKFKAFIDSLREQGLLPGFDEEAFDLGSLLGIEQRATVERYTKTMGENAGKPGNKITAFAAVKRTKPTKKNVPERVEETDADLF